MEQSQAHLISILQQQLVESRETEKNLRRINDSLTLALQTQNGPQSLGFSTIREIERKWEEKARRTIRENEEYWTAKYNSEVERRKQAERRLDAHNERQERSSSRNSKTSDRYDCKSQFGGLRENKMKHIQNLMDQIISQKICSKKRASEDRKVSCESGRKSGANHNSKVSNAKPLGCLSQLSNYDNTLRLDIRSKHESVDHSSSKNFIETERISKGSLRLLSKANSAKSNQKVD